MKFLAIILALIVTFVGANVINLATEKVQNVDCYKDPMCKSADIYLPHPTDCGLFFKCNTDLEACLLQCPTGLHWNALEKLCDWPKDACCSYSCDIPQPPPPCKDNSTSVIEIKYTNANFKKITLE